MVNVSGAGEVCPGPVTSTEAVPGVVIRLAGTDAVTCPAETNVVVNADPFHVTAVLLENPDPFTVSGNAGPPAETLLGEILVRISGGGVIVNVRAAGGGTVLMDTDAVPAFASSDAGTVAVIWLEFTQVLDSADPFQVTFTAIAFPATCGKLVPFTVSVSAALPATAELGERLESTGAGGLMMNIS
jgi:hypothetical protein